MRQHRHIIKRQVIEVEIASRLNSMDIQDRVAGLYNEKLVGVIDEQLTKKTLSGYNGKISRLDIDLGLIDVNDLEHSFLQKFELELENKLSELRPDIEFINVKKEGSTSRNSDIDLVIYYLRTGSLPWWAQDVSYAVLNDAFERVVEKNALIVSELLLRIFKDEAILKRFVYTFSDEILEKFIGIFFPFKSNLLNDLKEEFRSLNSNNINAGKLRENWWQCLIELCSDNEIGGNHKAQKVIETFSRYIDNKKTGNAILKSLSDNSKVITILNQIFDLGLHLFPTNTFVGAKKRLDDIGKSLSAIIDKKPLEHIYKPADYLNLKKYLDEVSDYFLFLQNDWWMGEKSIQADLAQLNIYLSKVEMSLSKIWNGRLVIEYDKKLVDEALIDIKKHLEQIKIVLEAIQNERLVINSGHKKQVLPDHVNFTNSDAKEFDGFSTSDKIYIQNAGLVLLWPFLSRFFENLGLLNDKAFVDEGAAEKACLMLQYLTEGQAENIFEAHLPLNKVLCGIELEQPVNTQVSIDAEEAEVCDDFLKAVIGNAPLWKNLSLIGFRRAYLKREGALGTRDGNWLLQVKREAYDVIIDKLPWPIQVVRLPWMEHAIFVEWQKV